MPPAASPEARDKGGHRPPKKGALTALPAGRGEALHGAGGDAHGSGGRQVTFRDQRTRRGNFYREWREGIEKVEGCATAVKEKIDGCDELREKGKL